MTDDTQSLQDAQVSAVLAAYFESVDAGRRPDPAQLLARYPHLAHELRVVLDAEAQLAEAAGEPTPAPVTSQAETVSAGGGASAVRGERFTPGAMFGPYELLELIGEGGMGVVYKARDTRVNRPVALKMIRAGRHASPSELARFQIEAKAAARLSHPGVVQLLDVGECDGQPFLASEFCAGGPLSERVRDKPFAPDRAARAVIELAEAIREAHEKGIVHRDLKPANVLLTADGRLKVGDFGLAKLLDHVEFVTVTNAILGSPPYMSPEQAEGKDAGQPADVYALGAILYELLTGRPPFRGATPAETLERVRKDEPVAPRCVNRSVPHDLQTVCLRCLEKDPARRFASAGDLAEELGRYLRGETLVSRPVGRVERTRRWCKRNPVPTVAALVVATVAAVAFGLISASRDKAVALANSNAALATANGDLAQRESLAKEDALRLAAEKGETVDSLRAYLYAADLRAAQTALDEGDVRQAIAILDRYRPRDGEPDRRCFAWWHLHHRCRFSHGILSRGGNNLHRLCASPDGKWVASGWGHGGGEVRVWDAKTGATVWTGPTPGRPQDFAFLAGGRVLAVACAAGAVGEANRREYQFQGVFLFDISKPGSKGEPLGKDNGRCLATVAAPGGELLACGAKGGRIELWDMAARKRITELSGHARDVDALLFTPDGATLASIGHGDSLRLWDVKAPAQARSLYVLQQKVTAYPYRDPYFRASFWRPRPAALALSPDGKTLAASGGDGSVLLWDLATRRSTAGIDAHSDTVTGVAFTPDGRLLVSTGLDRDVRVTDLATRTELAHLGSHSDVATGAVVLPSGEVLTSGDDGAVRRWSAPASNEPPEVLRGPNYSQALLFAVSFSPDGREVACGGWGYAIPLTETDTGRVRVTLKGFKGRVHSLAYSPDGRSVACGNFDEQCLDIWDATTGARRHRLPLPAKPACVRYDPSGKRVAVGMDNWRVAFFDPDTGQALQTTGGREIDFSDDGSMLVMNGGGGPVIRDPVTFEAVLKIAAPGMTSGPVFAPGGRLLAFAAGQEVVLFDVPGRRVLRRMTGHHATITAVAINPDGKTLASVSKDGRCVLWDVVTGQQKAVLRGHGADVHALAFAPDGRTLATAGVDQRVRLWRAPGLPTARPDAASTAVEQSLGFARTGGEEFTFKRLSSQSEEAAAKLADLTAKVAADPKNRKVWQDRAAFHCERQDWAAALADYDRFLELAPTYQFERCRAAACRLLLGDEKGYREDCALLAPAVPHGTDAFMRSFIPLVCCLAQDTVTDYEPLLAGARAAAATEPGRWGLGRAEFTVLYRMKRYREALAAIGKWDGERNAYHKAINLYWTALCQHQLGEHASAKKALAEAIRIFALGCSGPNELVPPSYPHAHLECLILRREAEALIGPLTPPEVAPFPRLVGPKGPPPAQPPASSLAGLRAAVQKAEQALTRDPTDHQAKYELARAHHALAPELYAQPGGEGAGDAAYRKAIALLEELCRDRPAEHRHYCWLGAAQNNLAMHLRKASKPAEARALAETAVAVQVVALWREPGNAVSLRFLANHFAVLADACLDLGDLDAARAAATHVAALPAEKGGNAHRAAVVLAGCSTKASADLALTPARRRELSERYAKECLDLLQQARKEGATFTEATLRRQAPIAPLLLRREFQEFLQSLKKNPGATSP